MKYVLSKFDESIKSQDLSTLSLPINGMFVVEVPPGVQIDNPADYATLKAQKLAGIIALYGGDFTDSVNDEFDSDVYIDTTNPDTLAKIGKYEVLLPDTTGVLVTTEWTLAYIPSQIVVYWSAHSLARTQNDLKGVDIHYTQADNTDLGVEYSFDAGVNFDPINWGEVTTPGTPTTGLTLRFTRGAGGDRYLGYYVVLYRA